MESFHTSKSRAADALLNGSLSDDDSEDAPLKNENALRLARIDEYQQESLRGEYHLEASFGALTGGIFKFAQHYEQTMTKLMDNNGDVIHGTPELERPMDTYLKLSRQAERNVKLLTRLAEDRRRDAKIKSQRHQPAVPRDIAERSRSNSR